MCLAKRRHMTEYYERYWGISMKLDLVFVTYNSEKWVAPCLASLARSRYPLQDINIFIYDNASTDKTVALCNDLYEQTYRSVFGNVMIIKSNKNVGFGMGNNLAAREGKADFIFFLNIDTELHADALDVLTGVIETRTAEEKMWELRQFPYEHPKLYHPVTQYTSWSSGAAFVIERSAFEKVGGFDQRIFMYAEDVDLSWRIRSQGGKIRYVPKAIVYHYSYSTANVVKPNQYLNSIVNHLNLRLRYGTKSEVMSGVKMLMRLFGHSGPYTHSRKQLIKKLICNLPACFHFMRTRVRRQDGVFEPKFLNWDYELIRDDGFYPNRLPDSYPLVSIIVRTCNRPDVLRETLISLRHQTYPNLEIVVVEDGYNSAAAMIEREFSDLNIHYQALMPHVGRSAAGNTAMRLAKGEYFNFLDDDDLFFADHVEVLVASILNTSYAAVYSLAFEVATVTHSTKPYKYTEYFHRVIHRQPFSLLILSHHNYIPIQSILFKRQLFDELGGLDESLDALEDWDMWLRYALGAEFCMINKLTSIYRVPYETTVNEKRQKALDDALLVVREKEKHYKVDMNAYSLLREYENLRK